MQRYLNNIFLLNYLAKINKKISGILPGFINTCFGFKMFIFNDKFKKDDNFYPIKEHNCCFLKMLNKIIKSDDTVLDIGAGNGFYSLYISKIQQQKGKIYCFENDISNFDKLLKNVFINSAQNIITIKTNDENIFFDKSKPGKWDEINESKNIKLILINSKKPFEIVKDLKKIIFNNLPVLYFDFKSFNDDLQKYDLFKYIGEKNFYNIFQTKKQNCNNFFKIDHAKDILFCENLLCLPDEYCNMI